MSYTSAPRFTASREACVCAETGRAIAKGETVYVDPKSRKVYATSSPTAKDKVQTARVGARLSQRIATR